MKRSKMVACATLLLVAVACEKQADGAPQGARNPATASPAAATAAKDPTAAAIGQYESLRQLLADDSADVAAAATALSKAADKAAAGASPAERPHYEGLAKTAKELAKKSGGDIDAIRKSYGDVSRHLVALLVAVPALQKGLYLFECPMAEGYKKWVQPHAKLENPYMGKKMLACGSKTEWKS